MRKVKQDIERPLSPENAVIYGQVVGLELAILECNQLGIEIERVDYQDLRRPRLVARNNHVTQQMMRQGKANNYGSHVKNGHRFYLNHTTIKGVRVVWEAVDFWY